MALESVSTLEPLHQLNQRVKFILVLFNQSCQTILSGNCLSLKMLSTVNQSDRI
ncbi:hypothetical protein [uncultured Nostoc sp.]|uniref:hypothetical protein n=1 Tax=uncultured Nostoc sp. TaxID=340711 RepID=UPI0035CAD580